MKNKTEKKMKRKRLLSSKLSKSTKRNLRIKKRKNYKIIRSKTPIDVRMLGEGMSIESNTSYTQTFDEKTATTSSIPRSMLEDKRSMGKNSSYAPTINQKLITIRSIPRSKLEDCNNKAAFEMKEPLKIGAGDQFFNKACFEYFTPEAKQILLKNLAANKHIKISDVVPPLQIDSNCWFNTMFSTLFISDKGRKFFHYFRQLMIEGTQANGEKIPDKLRNAFALLNFAVDASLTGNKYAYELNTNNIIRKIYEAIPDSYHVHLPYIRNVGEAGNPIQYYNSIINYLHHGSAKSPIELLYVRDCGLDWKDKVDVEIEKKMHLPHIIVIEIFDETDGSGGNSGVVKNKAQEFDSNGGKYVLDSCIIRDKQRQHFCATLTCEGKQFGYDGMSFHRIVHMEWKKHINSDFEWSFEGSNNRDGTPLRWNFTHGYQTLLYYRTH